MQQAIDSAFTPGSQEHEAIMADLGTLFTTNTKVVFNNRVPEKLLADDVMARLVAGYIQAREGSPANLDLRDYCTSPAQLTDTDGSSSQDEALAAEWSSAAEWYVLRSIGLLLRTGASMLLHVSVPQT